MYLNNTSTLNSGVLNQKDLQQSLNKLSSGLKINKASDDASGLAISDKLRTQATSIKQSVANANSAIAMMNIADKSLAEVSNILDIVKLKLIQAHTNTTNDDGRKAIKKDIEKLLSQIENITKQTNYNTVQLLSHAGLDFQVGSKSSDLIFLRDIDMSLSSLSIINDLNVVTSTNIDYSIKNEKNKIEYFYESNYSYNPSNSQTILLRDDMTKSDTFVPSTNNIADMVSNYIQLDNYEEGTHFDIEINSDNFKLDVYSYGVFDFGTITYSDMYLNGGGYIVPEDESTKKYFEARFNSTGSLVSFTDDGSNGDVGYGAFYFDMYGSYKESLRESGDYQDNSILMKNQNLKFTLYSDNINNFVLTNTLVNKIEVLPDASNPNLEYRWFVNPEEITSTEIDSQTNPSIENLDVTNNSCGTLKDLKEMPVEDFTFDCAGAFQIVVDIALTNLNNYRAEIGSVTNQLESSARNLMTNYTNTKAAESIIRDVDYSKESANFNKLNIINQAFSFTQVQANQNMARVLDLLK
jgi:flagellin